MPEKITDPVFVPRDDYNALDRFFLKLIRDERDLPFVYVAIKITLVMVPVGLAMYLPFANGWIFAALAVAYFILNNAVYKGSFGLMMHCTSHRKWFKKEYEVFNYYLPWVLGPFFGQTPETYYSHHIGMHHPENNMPDDGSSTMHYQRDNVFSFLAYFLHFLFIGLVELINYFRVRNRKKLMYKVIRGEFSFFLFCAGLSLVNFWATFMVFMFPFLVSRFIMMVGNFTQHTFVDKDDPDNAYKNSVTCINVKYNHKCWNDGYHISHHIEPTMHYTDHPGYFLNTLDEYEKNKALVFEGIGFLTIFILVQSHSWKTLTKYLVNINGMFKDEEEAIALMKERVQRIPKVKVAAT